MEVFLFARKLVVQTQIAILRGINVSGQKKIIMTELKELFQTLGFVNVQTYIQSGNIVFQSNETNLALTIKEAIHDRFTFDVPVQVILGEAMQAMMTENPFLSNNQLDEKFLHYTFLESVPSHELVDQLKEQEFPGEEFQLVGKVVYLYCPNGYGRAKLNNNFLERKLKVSATTRNHKTVNKLVELSQ